MKKLGILLCLVFLTIMFTSPAQAFDKDRKGFMLNLGAGFGQGKLKLSTPIGDDSEDGTGVSTDFKIGAGLSPQSVLYYTNRVIWWSANGVSINTGMSAAGYSYFFNPQAPSFFLSGSLGLGVASFENSDSESGFGWGIGAGYEFATNWVIEVSYLSAKVYDEGDFGLTASNLALTLSWFAY